MTHALVASLGPAWAHLESGSTASLRTVIFEKARLAAHLKRNPQDIPLARTKLEEWMPADRVNGFIMAWVLNIPVAVK